MASVSEITQRPLSGLNHIDALLGSGVPWNFIGRNSINFSFTLGANGDPGATLLNPGTLSAFNTAQQTQVRSILAYVTQLTGVRFAEVADSAAADLHFANADLHNQYTSQNTSSMSYTTVGGQVSGLKVDAWVYLDVVDDAYDNLSPTPGGTGYESLLHEIGHALGLKHSDEGGETLSPGTQLGADNTATTIMSTTMVGNPRSDYAPYDLAALQWLYGGDGLGGSFGVGGSAISLIGSVDADTLRGGGGADQFKGGFGSDRLEGGLGIDTALYDNSIAQYVIRAVNGNFVVSHKPGTDGSDTLVQMERLQFADKTVDLTVAQKAASVSPAILQDIVELYVAFFNRVPDSEGMAFWIGQAASGVSIPSIANLFYSAAVHYSSLTGYSATMTNSEFVTVIYKNVLGRSSVDADGMAFWTNALASGTESRGTLVKTILASAHTFKGDAEFGFVANLLDNKYAVGKLFSVDMGLSLNTPEQSISEGMQIAAAVTPTNTSVAISLIGVQPADIQLI